MSSQYVSLRVSFLAFKSVEVEQEFFDLERVDPRLFGMICALGWYVWRTFHKPLVITDVIRSTGRRDSPHRVTAKNPRCRAVDIRLRRDYFTTPELTEIRAFLEHWFPRSDQANLHEAIPTFYGPSRRHGEGDSDHLHCVVEWLDQFRARLGLIDG